MDFPGDHAASDSRFVSGSREETLGQTDSHAGRMLLLLLSATELFSV